MHKFLAVLVAALCAAPAWAADAKARAPKYITPPAAPDRAPNYKISFKMKAEDLEGAGTFLVEGGSQGSYNVGAANPKRVLTANCIPMAVTEQDLIRAECQFELSGALPAEDAKKQSEPVSFQYQGAFIVRPGKPLVLVEAPMRRLEVSIEEVPLPK